MLDLGFAFPVIDLIAKLNRRNIRFTVDIPFFHQKVYELHDVNLRLQDRLGLMHKSIIRPSLIIAGRMGVPGNVEVERDTVDDDRFNKVTGLPRPFYLIKLDSQFTQAVFGSRFAIAGNPGLQQQIYRAGTLGR